MVFCDVVRSWYGCTCQWFDSGGGYQTAHGELASSASSTAVSPTRVCEYNQGLVYLLLVFRIEIAAFICLTHHADIWSLLLYDITAIMIMTCVCVQLLRLDDVVGTVVIYIATV